MSTMNKLLERLERSCPEVAQKFSQSFTCTAKTPQAQQAEINGFLRCHLGSLEVNTQKEREYLIDQRPVGLWLRDLERHVFPILAQHGV